MEQVEFSFPFTRVNVEEAQKTGELKANHITKQSIAYLLLCRRPHNDMDLYNYLHLNSFVLINAFAFSTLQS